MKCEAGPYNIFKMSGEKPEEFSRRTFLNRLLGTAAGVAAAYFLPSNAEAQTLSPEQLKHEVITHNHSITQLVAPLAERLKGDPENPELREELKKEIEDITAKIEPMLGRRYLVLLALMTRDPGLSRGALLNDDAIKVFDLAGDERVETRVSMEGIFEYIAGNDLVFNSEGDRYRLASEFITPEFLRNTRFGTPVTVTGYKLVPTVLVDPPAGLS